MENYIFPNHVGTKKVRNIAMYSSTCGTNNRKFRQIFPSNILFHSLLCYASVITITIQRLKH
jgi:hypothetical protein